MAFDRGLLVSGPGALATAARVASWRPLVDRAAAAARTFGRSDLAVASYHLGVGNLAHATAGEALPFATLYFGSAPDRNLPVWRRLTAHGETAYDYYWKVLAAQRVMHLYRTDRTALVYELHLQERKNSAAEVMHPRRATLQVRTLRDLVRAWRTHTLRAIPHGIAYLRESAAIHIAVASGVSLDVLRRAV